MNSEIEKINEIRNIVKNKANEVSHNIPSENKGKIFSLLNLIDELEDELNEFGDIIDDAWDSVEVF